MDPALRARLAPHLAPGEVLRWVGAPAAARFRRGLGVQIGVMTLWTAFAAFWTAGVLVQAGGHWAKWAMASVGGLFLAIGIGVLAGLLRQVRAPGRLAYGVTDRRALIVRGAEVRGWEAGAIARPQRRDAGGDRVDLFFAVAGPALAAWMPHPPGKGAGGGLVKVGFVGVPPGAEPLLAALAAAPPPAGGPGGALPAAGTLRTFRARLLARVAEGEAAVARAGGAGGRRWLRAAPWIAGPPIAAWWLGGWSVVPFGLFVGGVAAIGAGSAAQLARQQADRRRAGLARAAAAAACLAAWDADDHPRLALTGWVDPGDAAGDPAGDAPGDAAGDALGPAVRLADSASSGRLKTWHRHRWARLAFATACGSPLVVEWVDKVKRKAGVEVARTHHLRGRLLPNPAVWPVDGLPRRFRAGPLAVRVVTSGGGAGLVFAGPLAAPEAAEGAIAALYAVLRDARRGG